LFKTGNWQTLRADEYLKMQKPKTSIKDNRKRRKWLNEAHCKCETPKGYLRRVELPMIRVSQSRRNSGFSPSIHLCKFPHPAGAQNYSTLMFTLA
jgi:hypothetical protein